MIILAHTNLLCWNFHTESPNWTWISPSMLRSQATYMPSDFACNAYRYGWIPQVPKVPKMSWGSSFAIYRECNLCSKNKKPRWFPKGLLLASQVNCNSFKLSGRIHVWARLSKTWYSSQSLGNKTSFQLCPPIKRTESYWSYAGNQVAMKVAILIKSF